MQSYFLPAWVHAVRTPDGIVFIDLKRDRYYGLEREDSARMRLSQDGRVDVPDDDPLAQQLLKHGLIKATRDPDRAISSNDAIETPNAVLVDYVNPEKPRVTARHVIQFILSLATAWTILRWRSLEYAVSRHQRLRRKLQLQNPLPTERLRELAKCFLYLRPIFYVASERCLFDSMVLSEFLRRNGVPCTCVFAVKTVPFSAHCWVQTGRFAIADTSPQFLATFYPVLAV